MYTNEKDNSLIHHFLWKRQHQNKDWTCKNIKTQKKSMYKT